MVQPAKRRPYRVTVNGMIILSFPRYYWQRPLGSFTHVKKMVKNLLILKMLLVYLVKTFYAVPIPYVSSLFSDGIRADVVKRGMWMSRVKNLSGVSLYLCPALRRSYSATASV